MVADIIRREEAEQQALAAEEARIALRAPISVSIDCYASYTPQDDERNKPDDTDLPDELETDMRAWAIRELTRLKAYVITRLLDAWFRLPRSLSRALAVTNSDERQRSLS